MSGNSAYDDDVDASGVVTVEDLRAMRRQRDAERERAAAAETARQRAERERDEARGASVGEVQARFTAEEQSIESQVASANAEAEAITERIAQLNAEGSFTEAAKEHRKLARAEARIEGLASRMEALKMQRTYMEQQVAQARTAPQLDARQRDWIEAHPKFNKDTRYTNRINSEHYAILADGIAQGSDEYYERLDQLAVDLDGDGAQRRHSNDDVGSGGHHNDNRGNGNGAAEPARRSPAMPVTRRSVDIGNANSNGPVRLSPEERESADISFPDVPIEDRMQDGNLVPGRYRQYLQMKQRLRQEGRMQ